MRVLELTLTAKKNQMTAIAEVILMKVILKDLAVFLSATSLYTLHSLSHHTPAVIKARSLQARHYI